MAIVAENGGTKTSQNLDNNTVVPSDLNNTKSMNESSMIDSRDEISQPKDDDDQGVDGKCDQPAELRDGADTVVNNDLNGFDSNQKPLMPKFDDMSELVDMLSQLNPMAQEFVPPSLAKNHGFWDNGFGYANNLGMLSPNGNAKGNIKRSEDEREMCARTIYCINIDKKISQVDVKLFFESFCGEVQCLRLLGDYHHSTRIAFVEFAMLRVQLLPLTVVELFWDPCP